MIRKESEERLVGLLKKYNIYTKKFRDVMACPYCRKPIFKADRQIDYMAIVGSQVTWIECKQATTSFPWANPDDGFRPVQRQLMDDWEARGVKSWIFLLMGDGSFPMGKMMWLIPWRAWVQDIEYVLIISDMKSLPWKPNRFKVSEKINAVNLLEQYWIPYVKGKGSYVPVRHWFAQCYPDLFTTTPMPNWTMDFKKESANGNRPAADPSQD